MFPDWLAGAPADRRPAAADRHVPRRRGLPADVGARLRRPGHRRLPCRPRRASEPRGLGALRLGAGSEAVLYAAGQPAVAARALLSLLRDRRRRAARPRPCSARAAGSDGGLQRRAACGAGGLHPGSRAPARIAGRRGALARRTGCGSAAGCVTGPGSLYRVRARPDRLAWPRSPPLRRAARGRLRADAARRRPVGEPAGCGRAGPHRRPGCATAAATSRSSRTTRGSVFSLCRRSRDEPERFPRYPRLPVHAPAPGISRRRPPLLGRKRIQDDEVASRPGPAGAARRTGRAR